MNESQRFTFLYFIKSYPEYLDWSKKFVKWSKIPLIKYWRAIFSSGLKEAKEEVELLQEKEYFQVNDNRDWSLSPKAIRFIDEMLSIDEIRIETIKWHLITPGLEDTQTVSDLYQKIYSVWSE